jgi:hypothetical protein
MSNLALIHVLVDQSNRTAPASLLMRCPAMRARILSMRFDRTGETAHCGMFWNVTMLGFHA